MGNAVSFLLVIDIIAGVIFFGFCLYVIKGLIQMKIELLKEKLDQMIDNDRFRWKTIRRLYIRLKQCYYRRNKTLSFCKENTKNTEVSSYFNKVLI